MNQSKKSVFPIFDKNNWKDIHKQSLLGEEEEENLSAREKKKVQTRKTTPKAKKLIK